jgi:PAS domain S-box-containing protein
MDGLQFLKNLRLRAPRLPVILLTGQGNEKIAVEAIKSGANDYLSKSMVNADFIHQAISTVIAASSEELDQSRPKPLSVLIVDNDREDLGRYIHSLNRISNVEYRFLEAEDFREALERLEIEHVDCLLLDGVLPDMDARQVLNAVHTRHPFLPVIVIAEHGNETTAAEAIKAGAFEYFAKSSLNGAQLSRVIVEGAARGAIERMIASKDAQIAQKTEALLLSEERYDLTVRGMNIGVWDWNILTNETYESQNLKRMLGIENADPNAVYSNFSDRLHPDDKEESERATKTHLARLGPYDTELRLRHGNGEYLWMHAYGQAQWDDNGVPVRMAGSITDITARKKADERREVAERALKESEETFRTAIEDASIGMALVATDGHLLKVNKALCDLLGYTEAELLRLDFVSMTHTDDVAETVEYGARALAGEFKTYQLERRFYRKTGRIVWTLFNVSLVRRANGEPNYFIAQIQDISERKEVERIKNEFISVVSHELRTPLTSVRGSLGLLAGAMSSEMSEGAKKLVNIAQRNAERLILLINDMLDMDKIASGQMRFEYTTEAVPHLIKQAVESNQPYGDKLSVCFRALPLDQELKIHVDPERLLQALSNLLCNAAKFSNPGDTVEVAAEQAGETVRILVMDHGTGIPEEFRSHIFSKFSQADSSGTRTKGGSGLGLYISKQIVEHMGGRIGYETEHGVGSTFWVEFVRR